VLELPRRVIELHADAPSGELPVWNSGTAVLDFDVQSSEGWLSVAPASGSVTDERASGSVVLTADPAGLGPGVHEAVVTLVSGSQTLAATVLLHVD
jgi:hypothetical protein